MEWGFLMKGKGRRRGIGGGVSEEREGGF